MFKILLSAVVVLLTTSETSANALDTQESATLASPKAKEPQITISGQRYQAQVLETLKKEEKLYNEGSLWYIDKDIKEIDQQILKEFKQAGLNKVPGNLKKL